jgi:transketolase
LHLTAGTDVTVFATGHLVWHALEAAKELAIENISVQVINIHTIKPLDADAIIEAARATGAVVSAEEHQRAGGLGSAVAEVLSQHCPTPQEYVAVNDSFGESGTPDELLAKYGLGISDVVAAIRKVLKRKSK